jgi:perosamine synthetase
VESPFIPVSKVELGKEVEESVLRVLRSGHIAQGPVVADLEQAFADVAGTRHAMAVTSGTTALVAALQALHLREGDEVLTSPFTFAATLNAIIEAGAVARFVDITGDYTIDVAAVDASMTDRTRVILPVHLYGLPARMDAIVRIARDHGAVIVEDAAQAVGARVGDRGVGSYGFGCFSLYATKNVTTGEGGVITTDDDAVAERIRILRNQGMRARYEYVVPGHNYRMTDLQAAVGIPQMARLDEIIAARRHNAAVLREGLEGIEGLDLPPGDDESRFHVYHQFTVRVRPAARLDRDALVRTLAEAGVGTGIYYPRVVYDYDCYRGHPLVQATPTPEAAAAAAEVLSLPVHPHLTLADVERIVAEVRSALDV